MVDDEDYDALLDFHEHWRLHSAGYANCYKRKDGKTATILMHRLILGSVDPNLHTDHIDHDRLNNQKQNLVRCTQVENNKNLPFNGVGRFRNKWRAFSPSPTKHLGVFDTEEQAREAVTKWLER